MTEYVTAHLCVQVRHLWDALSNEADEVDWKLEDTKRIFSETTRNQVRRSAFCALCAILCTVCQ